METGMSASYRVFYVTTWSVQTGKSAEAMAFFEQGMDVWSRLPGVTSVQAYANQFGLGSDKYAFEVWTQIEDYAVLDGWDRIDGQIRQDWLDLVAAGRECVEMGPARLMGDLVGSTPQELGGELTPGA
jgi:antibiotic biosynthesis monooxygenase (ABM) superfamily enzyme